MRVTDTLVPHRTLYTLILCLVLCAVAIASCSELSQEETKKVKDALADSLASTTESWDIDMKLIEEGVKKVRLRGSYAATYVDRDVNETRIKGPVHIDVFDQEGTVTTQLESGRAIYRAQQSEFEFFNNVRVHTKDGRHLESEYLKWQQADNTISTPKFVIITTPTDSIAGTGFRGTTDLTNYTISQPKGEVTIK